MQILKDIFLRKKKTIYNQLTFFLLNKSIIEEKEKVITTILYNKLNNTIGFKINIRHYRQQIIT